MAHTSEGELMITSIPTIKSREEDARGIIFQSVMHNEFSASLRVKENGIISGINEMRKMAKKIGLRVISSVPEGAEVKEGDCIATVKGTPKQLSIAEEVLIGLISKPSGIATAARNAVKLANGRVTVVCGAWKKMPFQIKDIVRNALAIGGVEIRICREPFIYLDKNHVRVFGSIENTIKNANVKELKNKVKVVQIRGETNRIEIEAVTAAKDSANIIFVDTGNVTDLEKVANTLSENKLREKIKLAFGGSIRLEDITRLCEKGVDILDIGRAIIDAPMLDISFDIHYSG